MSITQLSSGQILKQVDGLLIDLDGVLYIGDQPIEGAADAVARLKAENYALRFVTNTTTKSLETLHKKLVAMQLPIEKNEIISATQAAVLYLRSSGSAQSEGTHSPAEAGWATKDENDKRLANDEREKSGVAHPLGWDRKKEHSLTCFLVLADDPKKDFAEFTQTDTNPDYIVIGDIGKQWNYDLLNKIFNMVINGAEMIALHKGKFWQTEEGLQIDIGAFVAGLEYVTRQTATVIGKPSRTFFETALIDMGVKPGQAAMIGDDIDSDIGGAQAAGMKGILVKTGKYRQELVNKSNVKPDVVVDSISELYNI